MLRYTVVGPGCVVAGALWWALTVAGDWCTVVGPSCGWCTGVGPGCMAGALWWALVVAVALLWALAVACALWWPLDVWQFLARITVGKAVHAVMDNSVRSFVVHRYPANSNEHRHSDSHPGN
jgi:hypothetical protein